MVKHFKHFMHQHIKICKYLSFFESIFHRVMNNCTLVDIMMKLSFCDMSNNKIFNGKITEFIPFE